MFGRMRLRPSTLLASLCAIPLFGGFLVLDTALAQQPTSDEIIKALTPKPDAGGGRRMRDFRGVAIEPGTESKPPSIDLYINFQYDSAALEPEALLALRSLGKALQSQELKEAQVQIIGHTDAKGSDAYNQKLSERRADAVRSLLVGIYDIKPVRLEALGRGEAELKDKSQPEDGINRRVEIRNVTN